jgi:hypothetical protein
MRWRERHIKEISPSDLARLEIFTVVAEALALIDPVRGSDFQTRRLLLALELGEPLRVARALVAEAGYIATRKATSAPRSHAIIAEVAKGIEQSSDPTSLRTWCTGVDGVVASLQGRFAYAEERLRETESLERSRAVHSIIDTTSARMFRLLANCYLGTGRMGFWCLLCDESVRDAVRRGDFHAETSFRRHGNLRWLFRGRPDLARRELEQSSWKAPDGGYHLHHYYAVTARLHLALYEGNTASNYQELHAQFGALRRSLLMRLQMLRIDVNWAWGRFWLAVAAQKEWRRRGLRSALKAARRLQREPMPAAHAAASLLRASCAALRSDSNAAADLATRAEQMASAADLELVALAAGWLAAQTRGDEGAARAHQIEAQLVEQGCCDPPTFLRIFAPGVQK